MIPAGLEQWRTRPGGAAWLARLPRLVAELAGEWRLCVGEPFETHIAWVAPVRTADGAEAVLKVSFPEAESEHEPDALAWWAGRGAAGLLAADAARAALLVERLDPGTQLWSVGDDEEAKRIAAGVLRELHARPAPPEPFRPLAAEAPPQVVLHQDLHGGNVLLDAERGWLAVDPKPLAGDPAFDAASLLRDRRSWLLREPHPERLVARRLDVLAAELGHDRERLGAWGIGHALAWGLEDDRYEAGHLAVAAWLRMAA